MRGFVKFNKEVHQAGSVRFWRIAKLILSFSNLYSLSSLVFMVCLIVSVMSCSSLVYVSGSARCL